MSVSEAIERAMKRLDRMEQSFKFLLDDELIQEIKDVWEEEFAVFHPYGYILWDKKTGQPILNINRRTCNRPDEATDGAKCFLRYRRHITPTLIANEEIFLRGLPNRDNPWWGDRPGDSEDIDIFEELETEEIMLKRSLAQAGKPYEAANVDPAVFELYRNCTRLEDGVWVSCKFHTGYLLAQKALRDESLTLRQKAYYILPIVVRPSRFIKPLPQNGIFTHEDIQNGWARITADVIYRMKNWGDTQKHAYKVAYARMGEATEGKFFKVSSFNKLSSVAYGNDVMPQIRYEEKKVFLERGVQIPKKEDLLRVYRHRAGIFSICPLSDGEIPKGKFHSNILLHTAVTHRGKEVQHPDSWVRCGKANMSAVEFNSLKLESRKKLLGCVCTHCYQKEVMELDLIDGNYVVRVKPEVLLDERRTWLSSEILTGLMASGESGIDEKSLDDLRESFHFISGYDFSEMPEVGYSSIEEVEDDEEFVQAHEKKHFHDLVDWKELEEKLRFIRLSGRTQIIDRWSDEWEAMNRRDFFKSSRRIEEAAKRRRDNYTPPPSQEPPKVKRRRNLNSKVSPIVKERLFRLASRVKEVHEEYLAYREMVFGKDTMVSEESYKVLRAMVSMEKLYPKEVRKKIKVQLETLEKLSRKRDRVNAAYLRFLKSL